MRLLSASEWSAIPGSRDRFFAEAHKLSRAKHDSVLQLLDLGEIGDGHIYLAMELPQGLPLDRMIEDQGAMSGARVRRIGREIGLGLQAAAAGLLGRRDASAENIFLTTAGGRSDLVKIDFATADILAVGQATAPDDVRTLGLLLYQMVVGKLPVTAANEAPPDPALARPDLEIPTDLDALIMRALDPAPEKRWPDVASMLQVLSEGEKRASAMEAAGAEPDTQPRMDSGRFTPTRAFGAQVVCSPIATRSDRGRRGARGGPDLDRRDRRRAPRPTFARGGGSPGDPARRGGAGWVARRRRGSSLRRRRRSCQSLTPSLRPSPH